jgi:outer membrane murein-binding lipoprotein Lpp
MPRLSPLLIPLLALHLAACASTSPRPTDINSRINRLTEQEATLRAAVVQLEERQRSLQNEIVVAHQRAERARCEAKRDELAATTAHFSAAYSMRYAQHHACKADAAKGGGLAAALGCGAAAFLTGGWALALCGGALATGYIASESCDEAPPLPPPEQVQREALAHLRLNTPPNCDALPRPPASSGAEPSQWVGAAQPAPTTPSHLIGTGRGGTHTQPPPSAGQPASAPQHLVGTGRGGTHTQPPSSAGQPASAPQHPLGTPRHLVGTGRGGTHTQPPPAAASSSGPLPAVDPAAEARRRQRESERARAAHQAREKAAAEDRARVRAAQLDADWAREKAAMKARRRAAAAKKTGAKPTK